MFKLIRKAKKNQQGFTLVELMVVVVIIGILVAIAIPVYNNVTENAQNRADEATARSIASAVNMALVDTNGTQPTKAQIENYLNDITVTVETSTPATGAGWVVAFEDATSIDFEVYLDGSKKYPVTN